MNLEEAKILVKLARESVTSYFQHKEPIIPKNFEEKRGVFVTIHTTEKNLRGCIGFPYPKHPLAKSVVAAARAAAFQDPRFLPLKEKELNKIIFEVSVLTEPELIKIKNPAEYPKQIVIGKDGLVIECDSFSALLLPQVPVPLNWNAEQFLTATCHKAGLLPETWKTKKCKVYKFQAEIFREETPNGNIIAE